MIKAITSVLTHHYTMLGVGTALMGNAVTAGLFSGFNGHDWLQLAGAIIGAVLSFIAGKKTNK